MTQRGVSGPGSLTRLTSRSSGCIYLKAQPGVDLPSSLTWAGLSSLWVIGPKAWVLFFVFFFVF